MRWFARGLCCLLLLTGLDARATVVTTVDQDRITDGESVVVTYEVDSDAGQPDFTPLAKDFDIVDRNQSTSVSVVNSQATYRSTWSLVLMPKGAGELTLPAIRFGSESSEPRTIKVLGSAREPGYTGDVYIDYEVDDPEPYTNQQVLLTTKVYTAMNVADLNVSAPTIIEGKGSIDKLGRGREYQSVRGSRRYTVHEQRYSLVPRSTGPMKLSPIRVRGTLDGAPLNKRTAPLELEVLSTASAGAGEGREIGPRDLFLEAEIDKPAPYVQEQVRYTVRLFRSVALENATLSPPKVSGGDAVIERVGKDRQYRKKRGDRRYAVTERRFVVFPQTSGLLTIDPIQLQASVPLPYAGGGTSGFWNRPLTKPVRIESRALELTVRAPPADAPDPWLPARRVTLSEKWPEEDSLKVGTPITRHIIVTGDEMLASQLPELQVTLPEAVKSYPEQPQREDTAGQDGVSGRLEQTVALIPAQAGTFTVPAIELSWWNTRTDEKETLRLPAHVLHVAAGAEAAPPGDTAAAGAPAPAPRTGWWTSLGLGIAWALTLGLWWWDRRRLVDPNRDAVPDAAVESRRRTEKKLQQACRAGDPRRARDALLDWARVCWPGHPPRSLGTLARMADEAAAAEIGALQQVLYAPEGASWQGDGLYRAVSRWSIAAPRGGDGGDVLKPLYQH